MPISINSAIGADTTASPAPARLTPTPVATGGMSIMSAIGSAPAQMRTDASTNAPPVPLGAPRVPDLQAPPLRFEDVAKDFLEGAVAPFTGSYHAARALLADPAFRVLPISGQQEDQDQAERLGWKGAAFWGSMAVGGPIAKLPMALIWKLGVSGAASGATFAALEHMPQLIKGYEDPKTYAGEIATTATFAGLTGGALALAPPVAKLGVQATEAAVKLPFKAMNRVIDAVPVGKVVRAKTAQFIKGAFDKVWQPTIFTSGDSALRQLNLGGLADQLKAARTIMTLKGGELTAGFYKNVHGLTDDELSRVTYFIENFDFTDPLAWDTAKAYTTNVKDERLFGIAQREAGRLQEVGQFMKTIGMQVWDPNDLAYHRFALRKNYIPHRFVNPDIFREGGAERENAVSLLMQKKNIVREDAEIWLDNFSNRIEQSNAGTFSGKFPAGTSGHYLIGRALGLPGYETRLDRILPQYYEHAARRITNHVMFGPDPLVQAARFAAEEAPGGTLPQSSAVIGRADAEKIVEAPPKAKSMWQIIYARKEAAERDLARQQSIELKYPKAFAQLDAVPEGENRKLAETVLRRQLGMSDEPQFGKEALNAMALNEVVTKLSLGAIAQPSQMLSAVVRTGWQNSFKNFVRVASNDPEAWDFAVRSGVVLRSLVRESQMSLVGKDTDFLDKVAFTKMDVASRVYGAVQGATYADYMGGELAKATGLANRLKQQSSIMKAGANVLGMPGYLRNRIASIERRFIDLGINPVEVVQNGGKLTNDQLLLAGQKVSTDVNFWGDQLSLPALYRSPYGRYLVQFKSFGFQQSKLIKDTVMKPAVAWLHGKPYGDIGPLTRFAMVMPAGGEAISDLKSLARAKDRNVDGIARIMENISNAAGFGLAADAIRSTDFGVSGTLGLFTGPIGGTVGKGGAAFGEMRQGRPEKAGRFLIEYGIPATTARVAPPLTPIVATMAPGVANLMFPPKKGPKP